MVTLPGLVSVYVVEQLPEERVQVEELNLPVLLLVVQVTVPVGLDPDTVVVQVTDELMGAGLGEQMTDTDEVCGLDEEPKAYILPSFDPT
jgi:hypothetical protein